MESNFVQFVKSTVLYDDMNLDKECLHSRNQILAQLLTSSYVNFLKKILGKTEKDFLRNLISQEISHTKYESFWI